MKINEMNHLVYLFPPRPALRDALALSRIIVPLLPNVAHVLEETLGAREHDELADECLRNCLL